MVRPKKESIILHGVRDLVTLRELEPEPVAQANGWECVGTFNLRHIDDIMKACKKLNPVEHGNVKAVEGKERRQETREEERGKRREEGEGGTWDRHSPHQ